MFPNNARRTVMDPTTVFCPNGSCPARGQTGQGTIGIQSRKEPRFLCRACHKTFSATKGTVFYRLRTSAETVVLVVTLLAHGCPVQAIVAAFGFDERTVADWWARSGQQGQAVHEYLVEHPRDLGQVQADELRVKKQGGMVWMAMALAVQTRLWLGGEGSEQRDLPLIRRLIARVRRCAAHRPL
jgi:transposase-like protein